MKRLISKYDEENYTYMLNLLKVLGGRKLKYKWLISDIEAYPQDSELRKLIEEKDYLLLTTDELINYLEIEDFQWIWGVFSAIPMEYSDRDILQYELPDVSITERAFQDDAEIQHQLADIEIDCVDSAYFQIITRDEKIIEKLKTNYKYSSENLIDPIELFVTNDKRKSSCYFEFQYCKIKDINKKSLLTKIKDWFCLDMFKEDSIFLHMDFFEKFYKKYPYFQKTYSGDFCDWTSNYYSKEMTIEIIQKLKEDCYDKNNKLIKWLERAVNEYNGFCILGI